MNQIKYDESTQQTLDDSLKKVEQAFNKVEKQMNTLSEAVSSELKGDAVETLLLAISEKKAKILKEKENWNITIENSKKIQNVLKELDLSIQQAIDTQFSEGTSDGSGGNGGGGAF